MTSAGGPSSRGRAGEPLALADRALSFGGPDVQVTVTRERSLHSRFARSTPTQATDVDDLTVHVLALCDGHAGTAATNAVDDDALRDAVRRAQLAARTTAESGPGEHPGLAAPAAVRTHDGFDPATARLDPADAGAALRAAFAVAGEHRTQAYGLWSAGEVRTAIASSTGLRAEDAVTDVFFKVICRDEDGRSGYAAAMAPAVGGIAAEAVARQAVERLPRGEQAELPPGDWPVVLGEDAVGLLLAFLGGLAFNGLSHAEGRGALNGRLGTRVAAAAINLSDSPRFASTLPRAFDADGVPKAPLPLIQDGVAHRVVHDLRSAARMPGAASTGHATLPGGSPYGPAPTNLVMIGGGAADAAELAAPIERGLYVNRFWYVNAVHPKETLLTGVTRDGTFLIEDGRITQPLRDVRFTDTALGVLERVQALGSRPRLVGEGEFYGRRFATGVVCPPLRAGSLKITGGA